MKKHFVRIACRNSRKGNVLVEFSLMATLMLVSTLGVVDFGRSFNLASAAANAAAAGTQYASLSPAHYSDLDGMKTAALADLTNVTGASATATQTCRCEIGGTPVSCPANCSMGEAQTYVQVEVSIPFTTVAQLPWMAKSTNIKGKSVLRLQ